MNKKTNLIIAGIILVIIIIAGGVLFYSQRSEQSISKLPVIGKCGDGICDKKEKANPKLCPEDCKFADDDIPFYFLAIHNEPFGAGEKNYKALKDLIERANQYNMKLTLMFTPAWVDFILNDFQRNAELENWKTSGHEISAHHHSIYHPGNWDGYSDYTFKEATQIRKEEKLSKPRFTYRQGTLDDFMDKINKLSNNIISGCMNDEVNKNALPKDIIYDTCSGYVNFGTPGEYSSLLGKSSGKNKFISVGMVNSIERKWLTHGRILTEVNLKEAKNQFNSINNNAVYGGVVHSKPQEVPYMLQFMDFLHEKDPTGAKSMTMTEIIELERLPEKKINVDNFSQDKFETEDITFTLQSPNGDYDLTVRSVRPKLSLYSDKKFPAVLKLAGGWGAMTGLLNSKLTENAASEGIIFVAFDSSMRTDYPVGSSERDYKGFKDQDDVAVVLQNIFDNPNVDQNTVGVWSWSSGAILASGVLGRYPELNEKVKFFLDGEGPHCGKDLLEDSNIETFQGLRNWEIARDAKVGPGKQYATEDKFWFERCGDNFLGNYKGIYQRIQGINDHALKKNYPHAVAYLNTATNGHATYTKLNKQPKNQIYNLSKNSNGIPIESILDVNRFRSDDNHMWNIFFEIIEE